MIEKLFINVFKNIHIGLYVKNIQKKTLQPFYLITNRQTNFDTSTWSIYKRLTK